MIIANWKEHKTNEETIEFLKELVQRTDTRGVVVAPSYVALQDASECVSGSKIKISAQNMFYEDEGAYTGEVSPRMIKPFCDYVILGHSERRGIFNETDEEINKKVLKSQEYGITPIICVGESREEREEGRTFEVIERMLMSALHNAGEDFVIAYEPVWAISGGDKNKKPATHYDADAVHYFIKDKLREKYDKEFRVLYGGSVKPSNINEFMEKKNIDGALVGGASLDIDKFIQMIQVTCK
ncbi:MAG: triose-phosphate isomerase [Nanoarchaeota archaeon]